MGLDISGAFAERVDDASGTVLMGQLGGKATAPASSAPDPTGSGPRATPQAGMAGGVGGSAQGSGLRSAALLERGSIRVLKGLYDVRDAQERGWRQGQPLRRCPRCFELEMRGMFLCLSRGCLFLFGGELLSPIIAALVMEASQRCGPDLARERARLAIYGRIGQRSIRGAAWRDISANLKFAKKWLGLTDSTDYEYVRVLDFAENGYAPFSSKKGLVEPWTPSCREDVPPRWEWAIAREHPDVEMAQPWTTARWTYRAFVEGIVEELLADEAQSGARKVFLDEVMGSMFGSADPTPEEARGFGIFGFQYRGGLNVEEMKTLRREVAESLGTGATSSTSGAVADMAAAAARLGPAPPDVRTLNAPGDPASPPGGGGAGGGVRAALRGPVMTVTAKATAGGAAQAMAAGLTTAGAAGPQAKAMPKPAAVLTPWKAPPTPPKAPPQGGSGTRAASSWGQGVPQEWLDRGWIDFSQNQGTGGGGSSSGWTDQGWYSGRWYHGWYGWYWR